MTARTRLGLSGTVARPYGSFDRTPPGTGRVYNGPITRLGLSGTASRRYGLFDGKAGIAQFDKAATMSVVPIVNIGEVTDVDLDIGIYLTPVVTMSSSASLAISSTQSVVPILTQARSSNGIFGTFPKDATASVVPVLTMAIAMEKSLPIDMSVVPALDMASTVDETFMEVPALDQSVIPVLDMSSVVNITNNDKAVDMSAVPVLTMTINLNKVEARLEHEITMTVSPILDMSSALETGGEVDLIRITSKRTGHIRITKI